MIKICQRMFLFLLSCQPQKPCCPTTEIVGLIICPLCLHLFVSIIRPNCSHCNKANAHSYCPANFSCVVQHSNSCSNEHTANKYYSANRGTIFLFFFFFHFIWFKIVLLVWLFGVAPFDIWFLVSTFIFVLSAVKTVKMVKVKFFTTVVPSCTVFLQWRTTRG